MIQQDLLFDGQARKEMGQQQVLRNASDFWKDEAMHLIIFMSNYGMTFTSDDLRRRMNSPENPNAWGAIFSCASKQKIIKKTGRYIQSTTPSCHGRMIAVWEKY